MKNSAAVNLTAADDLKLTIQLILVEKISFSISNTSCVESLEKYAT